jgi:hypothetical protein
MDPKEGGHFHETTTVLTAISGNESESVENAKKQSLHTYNVLKSLGEVLVNLPEMKDIRNPKAKLEEIAIELQKAITATSAALEYIQMAIKVVDDDDSEDGEVEDGEAEDGEVEDGYIEPKVNANAKRAAPCF